MNRRIIIMAALLSVLMSSAGYAEDYDASTPHVIINQVFGIGSKAGYMSHGSIELYNPTDESIDLTGWAVHYRSSSEDKDYSTSWHKTELSGEIYPKHSYLIRGEEDPAYENGSYRSPERTLSKYDILLTGGGVFLLKVSQ